MNQDLKFIVFIPPLTSLTKKKNDILPNSIMAPSTFWSPLPMEVYLAQLDMSDIGDSQREALSSQGMDGGWVVGR